MEIVTGHRGTPHVTPYKVRDFNIGIVGAEDYVMNGGSELEAQLVSNNRIDIKDGSICMQGTHAVIPKNINDELTIENGMQGEKRIDLIVARYEKVADSGVESVNTVVLQGTPSKESPIVPGHVVGDIRNGDLKHEMPLYEVELDGINVIEVRPVFKKIVSAAEQQKMIELLNGKLEDLKNPNNYAWVALQSRTLPGSQETYLLAESLTSAVGFASATKGSAAIYIKKPGRYLIMARINIETTSPNVTLKINRRQSTESNYTTYREIGIQKNAGEYSQMTLLTTYDTNTAFGIAIKNNSPSNCNVRESVICIIPI